MSSMDREPSVPWLDDVAARPVAMSRPGARPQTADPMDNRSQTAERLLQLSVHDLGGIKIEVSLNGLPQRLNRLIRGHRQSALSDGCLAGRLNDRSRGGQCSGRIRFNI